MRPLPRYLSALLALAATTGGQAYAQKPDSEKPKAESPTFKKATGDLSKLKFMAGCWQGPLDQDTQVEEIWSTPSENLLVATTRILQKGRAIEFEFTRIEATDSGLVFAASSNGKPFDEYVMKTLVDEYVAFENPRKTFPQRIIYRLASDGALIPRNEGEGQPSIELRMKKTKCPGT